MQALRCYKIFMCGLIHKGYIMLVNTAERVGLLGGKKTKTGKA